MIKDIENTIYQTKLIGKQIWMKTNLNVSKYRNGDSIPQISDPNEWANTKKGAWCYYNNNPLNATIYGKLYNWYAVNDSRGLAPKGFHIPSINEYEELITFLDGTAVAGGKLKDTETKLWIKPNTEATNISCFSALPGGNRFENGQFGNMGEYGDWWSSSKESNDKSKASHLFLYYGLGNVLIHPYLKSCGCSVRCIKNLKNK